MRFFVISRIIKGKVYNNCYQLKAEADNTYRDLDNSGYHEKPNSIIAANYEGHSTSESF